MRMVVLMRIFCRETYTLCPPPHSPPAAAALSLRLPPSLPPRLLPLLSISPLLPLSSSPLFWDGVLITGERGGWRACRIPRSADARSPRVRRPAL